MVWPKCPHHPHLFGPLVLRTLDALCEGGGLGLERIFVRLTTLVFGKYMLVDNGAFLTEFSNL